jgi:hypothetical protein
MMIIVESANHGLGTIHGIRARMRPFERLRKSPLTVKKGTAMGHDEAVRILATEKYLLGELHPELRDQFEEHLFDCQACAMDLWAAATFLEHSKVLLST